MKKIRTRYFFIAFSLSFLVSCASKKIDNSPREVTIKDCLTDLEIVFPNFQRVISELRDSDFDRSPPKGDRVYYKKLAKVNDEFLRVKQAYDRSCKNISYKEIKALGNTLAPLEILLHNLPENSREAKKSSKIKLLQVFLNMPGYSVPTNGIFDSKTHQQLVRYLQDSNNNLTNQLNAIKIATLPFDIKEIHQQIENSNKRLDIIYGLAIAFLVFNLAGFSLIIYILAFQLKSSRELKSLQLRSSRELTKTIDLFNKKIENQITSAVRASSSPSRSAPVKSRAIDPVSDRSKESRNDTPAPVILAPPPKSPPPSGSPSTETLDDLPPTIRELVKEYNQKGWQDLRYQHRELKEASEPIEKLKSLLKSTENSPSVKIFETKGYNKGDYLVFEFNSAFESERSLWLFPKRITASRLTTIEYLFEVDEEVKKDYDRLKLERPAQLNPQDFKLEDVKLWEVKLIRRGAIVAKEAEGTATPKRESPPSSPRSSVLPRTVQNTPLPERIQKLLEIYNSRDSRSIRDAPDIIEATDSPERSLFLSDSPSAITFETTSFNQGNYFIWQNPENLEREEKELWIFPKTKSSLPSFDRLFTLSDNDRNSQRFTVIRPARLKSRDFTTLANRQWNGEIIDKGELRSRSDS